MPTSILFLATDSTNHLTLQAFSPAAGARRTVLAEDSGDIAYPALSPDGRHLAYAYVTAGQAEVVVRSWPSLDARLVVGTGSIYGIAWSRGGKDLLYADYHDALSNEMMAVDMSGESGLEPGAARPLFLSGISRAWPLRAWDVTADEDLFLTFLTEESSHPPDPEIHIVLNWFRQLRAGR